VYSGDYKVDICCFEQPIPGSPFAAQASDTSQVLVSNFCTGTVGQASSFSSKSTQLVVSLDLVW